MGSYQSGKPFLERSQFCKIGTRTFSKFDYLNILCLLDNFGENELNFSLYLT